MTGNDCRQVQQLWLEKAEGRSLSADEQSLLARHRESCKFCRAEEDWVQAAGHDAGSGPAPVLDDLACRRWVDDVLDRAEEAPATVATARHARWIGAGVAAAAILLLVASATLWVVLHEPAESPTPFADETPAVVTTPDPALLLLLSGGSATVDRATPAVGDTLPAAAELTIEGGRAVVQLQDGLRVSLEEGSLSYQPSAQGGVDIALYAGKLYLLADPERPGGPIDVTTRTGTVRITGTYLSVEDGGNRVAVEVYRGSVQVAAFADEALHVMGGQRLLIGTTEILAVDDHTNQHAGQIQDLLQLLGHSRYSAMEVRSIPEGAMVSLDGCPLGPTPLTAHVVAGLHKLELEAQQRVPAREFIQLDEGDRQSRTIELMALADYEPETVAVQETTAVAPALVIPDSQLAAQLLQQAQAQRTQRAWSDAAATYRQLTDEYPQTPEARASWVSLGTLQLDQLGQPAEALNCFDTYLATIPGGSLAQEATFERARALRAMGDRSEEVAAWQLFLDRFPDALEAPLARQYMEQAP